jgi:hypothetical protein
MYLLSLDQSSDDTGFAVLEKNTGAVIFAGHVSLTTVGDSPSTAADKIISAILREISDSGKLLVCQITTVTLELIHWVKFAESALRLAYIGGALEAEFKKALGCDVYFQSITRVRQLVRLSNNADTLAWGRLVYPSAFSEPKNPKKAKAHTKRMEDIAVAMAHGKAYCLAAKTIPPAHDWMSQSTAEIGREKRGKKIV